ncbi:uncharacterized protein LOC132198140 [Neocloeon triangulifer]|uniref:uncharacterized protein LOC132198140 n=1 Tax=Neocloeon triangulifer TaxID=2078957 RepID=UPI00286F7215|nr:uncharacterized protein LOC132198140 [Neocloeon triangulifer]
MRRLPPPARSKETADKKLSSSVSKILILSIVLLVVTIATAIFNFFLIWNNGEFKYWTKEISLGDNKALDSENIFTSEEIMTITSEIPLVTLKKQKEKTLPMISSICRKARSFNNLRILSNGKRYFFSFPADTTWEEANSTCKQKGLQLASLKIQDDINVVWREVTKIGDYGSVWWLSAKDLGVTGRHDFRWYDGTMLDTSSELWSPKDASRSGCVRLVSGWSAKLYRGPCSEIMYYICELPIECY